jgi:hypothetical protein
LALEEVVREWNTSVDDEVIWGKAVKQAPHGVVILDNSLVAIDK